MALAVALGAVALAGCSTGSEGSADALTVYSGQHVQTTQTLVAEFERQTGISVNVRSDDEDVLADQIVTEGSRSPADVYLTENSPPLQYLASKGLLASVDPSTLANTPSRFNSPDGKWVGVSARVSVMVYNTSLLKPSELPTSVMDLADPQWRGKIAVAGAETDFQPIITSIVRAHGEAAAVQWLEAVKANAGSHDYPDNETITSEVNSGQVALGIINQYYWYREKAQVGESGMHSAIAYFAPHDPGYVIDVSGAAILKSSPPPGRGSAIPGLPDLEGRAGDHRPQRQLRVPDRVGCDDGATRDSLRPAAAEQHHHPRARHRGRGDQTAAGGPTAVTGLAAHGRRGGRRRLPPLLTVGAVLVSVAVLLPLAFLVVQAVQVGWAQLDQLLFRNLTATLIWNTVKLVVVVTALCAVVGTLAAWFVERTDVPCRRLLTILVVIPLGIPDFVVSFGWRAIFPAIGGFWAAVLVMTLAVYPLVFLPVAASLRSADPAQEEVARSLGLGRVRTFWTVTVGQARLAIFGGAVLVGLVVLAEFGAFEILGYQTLTTEIYNEFQVGFNQPAACALSLILVLLGALLLASEGAVRGRGRTSRLGAGAQRQLRPVSLGRLRVVALTGLVLLVVLALGVPVGAIVYLIVQGGSSTLPATASLPIATLNTFGYAAAAGVLATLAAVPIALLSVRFPRRQVLALERSNLVVLAVPGLVIALSLTYVTEHFLQGRFYLTSSLLVLAYAIMFFPLAVVSVRAAVARAPVGLEEVGNSLGVSRRSVLWRVTLPLVGPGLAAAFALVFLETATELTATLVLHPTNIETLATQFWAFESNGSYSQAAPYAGMLILIAAVPGYVLGRWFDRQPERMVAAGRTALDTQSTMVAA